MDEFRKLVIGEINATATEAAEQITAAGIEAADLCGNLAAVQEAVAAPVITFLRAGCDALGMIDADTASELATLLVAHLMLSAADDRGALTALRVALEDLVEE